MAQDVRSPAGPAGATHGSEPEVQVAGLFTADDVPVGIGHDKIAPLCPEFCAPERVTSPEFATVGERDVLSYTIAAAASDGIAPSVDGDPTRVAQLDKFPSTATSGQAPSVVTQDEFRPALDPVLAAPTTEQVE